MKNKESSLVQVLINVLLSGWGDELFGAAAAVAVTGVGVLGTFGGKSC